MSVLTITKENYEAEVINSDKPVLLDFWAPWCGPCQVLSPIIEEISNETEAIKVGKVNTDEQPELAGAYKVMGIPTVVLIKDGKVENKSVGVVPKATILQMLE